MKFSGIQRRGYLRFLHLNAEASSPKRWNKAVASATRFSRSIGDVETKLAQHEAAPIYGDGNPSPDLRLKTRRHQRLVVLRTRQDYWRSD
jgi:hypothetical protein